MKNPEDVEGFIGKTTEPDSEIEGSTDDNSTDEALAVCHFKGYSYSPGTVICINGRDAKCKSTGKWTFLGTSNQC